MRTHNFPGRAGRRVFALFLLTAFGLAAQTVGAQQSRTEGELAAALYPRASFLEEATRRLELAKGPNWTAAGAYRTDDSLEDVVKYYKEQAKKYDAKNSPDAVLNSLLRENWKIGRIGFIDRSFYGLGGLLKTNLDEGWGQGSFGVLFLGDAIVRVQVFRPRLPKGADGSITGTLIILIRERWDWPRKEVEAGVEEEKVGSSDTLTRRAVIISRPEPEMTEESRRNGISGTVVLRAVFSSSGKVTNIRVVQGLPYGLTEKAVKAASKIKFEPAIKDGHFVSQYIQLEYNFSLGN